MNKKIGFIGCGKMASAIISGIKSLNKYEIKGAEINSDMAKIAQENLNIPVLTDNKALVFDSDIVFIAVKPNQVGSILNEIKSEINGNKLIVSIAAGIGIDKIESILGNQRIIRIMPNTPALVNEGMFGICKAQSTLYKDLEIISEILSNLGKCVFVEENQMDIVTAISGSGPAFFYKIIEDMARAGENLGLDYEKALLLATQTALGSAKMIFNRGETSVKTLIDNVATKGGCTYEGITAMKELNSENLFKEVIFKTTKKASLLGK